MSVVKQMPIYETNKEATQAKSDSVQKTDQNQDKDCTSKKTMFSGRGQRRNRRRNQSVDLLFEKALKLANSGRVEFLDNNVYNVIGDHGTYTVALDYTGKLSCNCPGFLQKGKCSHAVAVMIITKGRHKRRH